MRTAISDRGHRLKHASKAYFRVRLKYSGVGLSEFDNQAESLAYANEVAQPGELVEVVRWSGSTQQWVNVETIKGK